MIGCLILVRDGDSVSCCEQPAVTVVHVMCDDEPGDVPACAEHLTDARRMGTTRRYVVSVPRLFFEDHRDRDLIEHPHTIVRASKTLLTVELDERDITELRSDAWHYGSFTGEDYTLNRREVNSARRTIDMLAQQGWSS